MPKVKLTIQSDVPKHPATKLKFIANIEDRSSGRGFDRFLFRTPSGSNKRVTLPRSATSDSWTCYKQLRNANAELPDYKRGGRELVESALHGGPEICLVAAERTGWQPESGAFVHPQWVSAKQRGLTPPLQLDPALRSLKMTGTQEGWVNTVGRASKHSSTLRLTLAASFAASLLEFANIDPFVLVLHGRSKSGKTFALSAAGSVIGFGKASDLPKFNATRAALLEQASAFHDIVYLLDETRAARDQSNFAREFDEFIYAISGGSDDRRHSSFSQKGSFSLDNIRTIVICTSETPRRGGFGSARQAVDGSMARCFDVAAVRAGHTSIFDLPPKDCDDVDAWITKSFEDLGQAYVAHHGQALFAFVKYLASIGGGKVRREINRATATFEKAVGASERNQIARHAAKCFGLLYAAACLANSAGLLPVKPQRLRRTLRRQFVDALAEVRDPSELQKIGFKRLKTLIERTPWEDRAELSDSRIVRSSCGFVVKGDKSNTYYIKRDWLKAKLKGTKDVDLFIPTMTALADRKILKAKDLARAKASNFSAKTTRRSAKFSGKTTWWIKLQFPT